MSQWEKWLSQQAAEREEAGLRRSLAPRPANDRVLDLAGNDYLGLSRDPVVAAAAADAALLWGAGSGASPLVTGSLALHAQLEEELADFTGRPAALVLSTGYHANLAVVTALADRDTLIVSDAHIHASLVDAVRLSRARLTIVPHSDVAAVRAALAAHDGRALVAGRVDLLGARRRGTADRAGRRLRRPRRTAAGRRGARASASAAPAWCVEHGLAGAAHVIVTATLSKALGAQGGAVLCSPAIRDHLVNKARPFIYDTGLAPAAAAGALAALGVLRARPDLPDVVRRRADDLAAALGVEPAAGAVLSVPMPSPQVALAAQASALEQGVRVGCFRPPSVPDGISRLRITVGAGISDDDWERATEVLVAVVKEHA